MGGGGNVRFIESGGVKIIGVRGQLFMVLAIAATIFATGAVAEEAPASGTLSALPKKSELLADYAQPIISLDEVINPASSMEGGYPVTTYGTYTGRFFWMDNHRLIKSTKDKDEQDAAIESWDVDSGSTSRYGRGLLMCYADGKINKFVHKSGTSSASESILQRGLLGEEKDFVFDKTIRVYDNKFECGDQPSTLTTQYVKEHPDAIVVALRPEHGFLVTAKRTMFPDGRTKRILEQDEIELHAIGTVPKKISVPSRNVYVAAYYYFVNAYVLYNADVGFQNIYFLLPNGEVRTVQPPEGMVGSSQC